MGNNRVNIIFTPAVKLATSRTKSGNAFEALM